MASDAEAQSLSSPGGVGGEEQQYPPQEGCHPVRACPSVPVVQAQPSRHLVEVLKGRYGESPTEPAHSQYRFGEQYPRKWVRLGGETGGIQGV